MRGSLFLGWLFAILPTYSFAELTSYHFANPVSTMHALPVGETPGWSGTKWFNFEFVTCNIWNQKFSMTDRRNGHIYYYFADFEQQTAKINLGTALSQTLAFSVEVPYDNHNGGFTDDFVDRFHQWIGSDRFTRNISPKYNNQYIIRTNGVDALTSEHAHGVGNIKTKLKYWFAQWKSPTPGICDCGLAVSAQAKFPTQTREHGLSSGTNDYSGLLHAGIPLGSFSGMWATAAYTKVGRNDTFAGWPKREWLQMYELSFNIGYDKNFGVMLQGRYESPLFMKEHLDFNYTTTAPSNQLEERVSSGWNALTAWRGSEAIGFYWRWGMGSRVNLIFVEDWGVGGHDHASDGLYINNAPDFELLTQWHFVF